MGFSIRRTFLASCSEGIASLGYCLFQFSVPILRNPLYQAIRAHGIPEVLVSDNGSIFTSHETRRVCEQLGIEKKEIKKRRPYQNYVRRVWCLLEYLCNTGEVESTTSRMMTYLEGKPKEDSSMSITWKKVEDM